MQTLELYRSRIPSAWDGVRNQLYIPAAIIATPRPSQRSRAYTTNLVGSARGKVSPRNKQLALSPVTRSLLLSRTDVGLPKVTGAADKLLVRRIATTPKRLADSNQDTRVRDDRNLIGILNKTLEAHRSSTQLKRGRAFSFRKIMHKTTKGTLGNDQRVYSNSSSKGLTAHRLWDDGYTEGVEDMPRIGTSKGTKRNKKTPSRVIAETTTDPMGKDVGIYGRSLSETLEAHRLSTSIRRVVGDKIGKKIRKSTGSATLSRSDRVPRSLSAYEGCVLEPRGEWLLDRSDLSDRLKRPWSFHDGETVKSSEDAHTQLTDEILAFSKYLDRTDGEEEAANQAFTDIKNAIESSDIEAKAVELVGSRSTGLAMPLSDLDINIRFGQPDSTRPHLSKPRATKKLCQILKIIESLQVRRKFAKPNLIVARVPILETQHLATGLAIQLQSTINVYTTRDLTKAYLSEFPTLRPLFLLLRQTLKMRGLGDGSTGVGSYALIIMIVATLKFSGARFAREDVGRQLIYFLDFFTKIDFESVGISADPLELFQKKRGTVPQSSESSSSSSSSELAKDLGVVVSQATSPAEEGWTALLAGRKRIRQVKPDRPYLMCLQDPANPVNDLGCNSNAIKHIQATFGALKKALDESMNSFASTTSLDSPVYLLDPFVLGSYEAFEEGRRKLGNSRASQDAELVDVMPPLTAHEEVSDASNAYKGCPKT